MSLPLQKSDFEEVPPKKGAATNMHLHQSEGGQESPGAREPGDQESTQREQEFGQAAEAELKRIYDEHYRDLYKFVYRFVRAPEVTEELIQDAFLTTWRQRHSWFRSGNGKAYLYTVARNLALNHIRHERVELKWNLRVMPKMEEIIDESSLQEIKAEVEETNALIAKMQEAVAALPERARLTLTLRLDRQLSNSEIAEAMQITVKAVERNITRSFDVLRDILLKAKELGPPNTP